MWILAFFSILSVGLYRIVSSRISIVRRIENSYCGAYLAKAAVVYALQERKADTDAFDTLYELGRVRERSLGMGKFRYSFSDEGSRININTVSAEVLAGIPGLDRELAGKIVNSVFRPFPVVDELLLIEGIDQTVFSAVQKYITVYGDGGINLNTASSEILRMIGMNEELVSLIEAFRRGDDGMEGTEDDGCFKNTGEIVSLLRSEVGLSSSQEAVLEGFIGQGMIVTVSPALALNVDTEVSQRQGGHYRIVIDGERVREWREY